MWRWTERLANRVSGGVRSSHFTTARVATIGCDSCEDRGTGAPPASALYDSLLATELAKPG